MATAPWPLNSPMNDVICAPSSARPMSRMRSTLPAASVRTTMFSNCSGVCRRPIVLMRYCTYGFARSPPTLPAVACRFCEATAALTSATVTPRPSMRTGSSQMRIAYVSPMAVTEPTPSTRESASAMFFET